jgi:hypothetical protein
MTENLVGLGTILFASLVGAVLQQIATDTMQINLPVILAHVVSITCLVVYLCIVNYVVFDTEDTLGVFVELFSNPTGLLNILLGPLA